MNPKPLPGAFILGAADCGLQAAAKLTSFAPSATPKDLITKISISATLLSEIGKEVNRNATCFKDNFQETFEQVTVKCENEYNQVLAALEKAMSWKKGEAVQGTEELPKSSWKRVKLALAMDKDELDEFEKSLDESYLRALMLQYIVSLVVLQIRAQKQDLSSSELNVLGRLKKALSGILESIRETDIASVVAFGLSDLTKAANAIQVVEAAKSLAKESSISDDASIISTTTTVLNQSVEISTPVKKEEMVSIPLPQIILETPKIEDKYEMYRASNNIQAKQASQKVYRILGIPIKVDRTEREATSHLDRIPTSAEEIKSFIEKQKDDTKAQPATLNSLVNISPATSTAIYSLINDKNEERIFPRRIWSTELLVPWEWWEGRRLGRKQKVTDGYIVILRGEVSYRPFSRRGPRAAARGSFPGPPPRHHHVPSVGGPPPPPGYSSGTCGPPPPPPMNWHGGPPIGPPGGPPVIVNLTRPKKTKKKAEKEKTATTNIELTQQETETVINDFLSTFSTLYDGIPVGERGAALKAINLEDADDLVDYDSDDSSSSGSSRSLVDD